MAQILRLTNFGSENIINEQQTELTDTVTAGSSTLPVGNTDDFASDGFILLGYKGADSAEMVQAGTVSAADSIPLQAETALIHAQYDPLYPLFGDQLRIYRAANVDGSQPADGSFTLLDTIPIDAANALTVYEDAAGGGGYWYKKTHYNSVSEAETPQPAQAIRGDFTPDYVSLDEVRGEAGFANAPFVTDDKIALARAAAQSEIDGGLNEFYAVPLQVPISDYLRRITMRLAAGYLRLGQYASNQDPKVNGQGMVDDAQAQLTKLIMKERELMTRDGRALDAAGATGGINGYPNGPGFENGSPRLFRMRDVQGQPLTSDRNGFPVGNLYYGRKW